MCKTLTVLSDHIPRKVSEELRKGLVRELHLVGDPQMIEGLREAIQYLAISPGGVETMGLRLSKRMGHLSQAISDERDLFTPTARLMAATLPLFSVKSREHVESLLEKNL